MKKGFTLIELLVVVLIIGILSAIALPKYQRAVKKARAAEAKINLNTLVRASEVACLADPSYSGDMSSLDVNVQDSSHWHYENNECVHENGHSGCSWDAANQDDPILLLANSREYNLAAEQGEEATLMCQELETNEKPVCPQYGFAKYLEDWGMYVEP